MKEKVQSSVQIKHSDIYTDVEWALPCKEIDFFQLKMK